MLRTLASSTCRWKIGKRSVSSYKEKSFKENWLGDKGSYPVIGILAVAIILPAIAGAVIMLRSPDNRFFKPGRKQIFRGDIMDDDKPWKADTKVEHSGNTKGKHVK